MQQTELKLTKEDRERIGEICAKGVRQVRFAAWPLLLALKVGKSILIMFLY